MGGKTFTLLKFRTMKEGDNEEHHRRHLTALIKSGHTDGEGLPMTKPASQSRLIPLGGLLRKSCIDELPQLFNVLLGDMSLVGPRPPIPYEVDAYQPWHLGRFSVTPGMTGLWQVSGKNRLSFNQMVRLDIQYARRRSLWLDMSILLRTPLAVLGQIRDESAGSTPTQGGAAC